MMAEIARLTDGVGCDIYIEATGHPSSVQQGLDIIRKGRTFVGSQLSPHCHEDVISALSRGEIRTQGMISHQFPLEDWEKAYAMAQSTESVKVLLRP